MIYQEEEFLLLSGLQHFAFCRRQWALIHLEQQWAENGRTMDGQILHERAHDPQFRESRRDRIITRSVSVYSARLGVSGQCDVVEYQAGARGSPLPDGRDFGNRFQSSIRGGNRSRRMQIYCSCAPKPCALKICSAVTSLRALYTTA